MSSTKDGGSTSVWGTLGTIRPHLSFDVEKDVQTLLGTVSGRGVDYRTIIDLLTNRSNEQCQQIAKEFLDFTKQDLLTTLQAAVPANLEGFVAGLLRPAAQYDAHEIKAALKVQRLARRSRPPLATSHHPALLSTAPHHGVLPPTPGTAWACFSPGWESGWVSSSWLRRGKRRASRPAPGSEGCSATSLCSPSVFSCYQKRRGLPVEEAVQRIFRGQAQAAGLTLGKSEPEQLPPAEALWKCWTTKPIQGVTLARIMISRRETDLLSVRVEFRKHYGVSLYSFLMTDGNGQAAVLGLCRAEDL
uniref:Annexin n=1 Tax=Varanus komodoensis TaxID=61221 RepID=A0A8D2J1S0_VARKO